MSSFYTHTHTPTHPHTHTPTHPHTPLHPCVHPSEISVKALSLPPPPLSLSADPSRRPRLRRVPLRRPRRALLRLHPAPPQVLARPLRRFARLVGPCMERQGERELSGSVYERQRGGQRGEGGPAASPPPLVFAHFQRRARTPTRTRTHARQNRCTLRAHPEPRLWCQRAQPDPRRGITCLDRLFASEPRCAAVCTAPPVVERRRRAIGAGEPLTLAGGADFSNGGPPADLLINQGVRDNVSGHTTRAPPGRVRTDNQTVPALCHFLLNTARVSR